MRLLMISGDQRLAQDGTGPLASLLDEFSQYWEKIAVVCPGPKHSPSPPLPGPVQLFPRPMGMGPIRSLPELFRQSQNALHTVGADLIVSHDYSFGFHGMVGSQLAHRHQIPHISEIHGIPAPPFHRPYRDRLERGLLALHIRRIRDRVTAVRTVNQGSIPQFLRSCGVPRSKILYLPAIYLDPTTFFPPQENRPREIDIVWAGRMVAEKGLDILVETLRKIDQSLQNRLKATLIGDGPLRPYVEEKLRAYQLTERVSLTGWLPDQKQVAAIYRQSRIVLVTSAYEGGPRFPLEAAACGSIIVSPPIGVLPDLFPQPKGALLVPRTAHHLALAIEKVLHQPQTWNDRSEAAKAGVSHLDRKQVIGRYAKAYLERARTKPTAPPSSSAHSTMHPDRSKSLRIAILTQLLDRDHPVLGATHDWIEALSQRTDSIHVLTPSLGQIDLPVNVTVSGMGKPLGAAPVQGWARFAMGARLLTHLLPTLLRGQIDLIFAHMNPVYAILCAPLARLFRCPTVLWYTHAKVDRQLRIAHTLVDAIATASPTSFSLPSSKRHVLGHGISGRRFDLTERSPLPNRTPSTIRIITLGRISPVKDLLTLVRTAGLLHRQHELHSQLTLAGPTLPDQEPYQKQLENECENLEIAEHVFFPGEVAYDQVPQLLEQCNVFASACPTGSFDKAVLEAMLSGRPVFTCNEDFLPLLGEDRDRFFFRTGSPESLAKQIAYALAPENWPETRSAALRVRHRVRENHEVNGLADRLVTLFHQLTLKPFSKSHS
ncbi:MAG: glycosyltransferase [Planctomycetota bacterium]|nr:glycosyltransferase [Planctomycetota bacterium]